LITQCRYSICITELATEIPRFHAAGDVDRAGEQQQLLGERGLARVRVGDDGEGAAAGDFPVAAHRMRARCVSGQPPAAGEARIVARPTRGKPGAADIHPGRR